MFKHEKQLFHPVEVERANPQYAVLLQEQLGGGNGELKAAMQYMSQSFRIKDPEIKDLFLDIAAEELGHMEMVAQTINLLNGHDVDATQVQAGGGADSRSVGLESRPHQFVGLLLDCGLRHRHGGSVRRSTVQYCIGAESQGGVPVSLPSD